MDIIYELFSMYKNYYIKLKCTLKSLKEEYYRLITYKDLIILYYKCRFNESNFIPFRKENT